jgi:uncharacterized protein YegL
MSASILKAAATSANAEATVWIWKSRVSKGILMSDTNFLENPNLRIPCVILVDDSHSMLRVNESGLKMIQELNSALTQLESDLQSDDYILVRGIVSVIGISGDGGKILHDWSDASSFFVEPLVASDGAVLTKGISLSLQMIAEITDELRAHGVSYVTPILIVISGGHLDDSSSSWLSVIEKCREIEAECKVRIYLVGMDSAACTKLRPLSVRAPKKLSETRLAKFIASYSAMYYLQDHDRQTQEVIPLGELDPWRNVGI